MTNAEKIIDYLILHRERYCDDCIANLCDIHPRQQVNQICNKALPNRIETSHNICFNCGKMKLTRIVSENNNKSFICNDAYINIKEQSVSMKKIIFDSEKDIVDYVYNCIQIGLKDTKNITLTKEGLLEYSLPNNKILTHKSDIQINSCKNKMVSIEIKFRSAVTDQFKCRSYDMYHLKNSYGENLLGILIFVKSKGHGISIEQAKNICYIFDYFIGILEDDIEENNLFSQIIEKIKLFCE
jgi:hypothetical protein